VVQKTRIFVDGNCIVCDLEISHYKRLAPQNFELIDISSPDFAAQTHGLSPEAVNRHMHAITPDGQVIKGVDAFAHIWSRIPSYSWASRWIKLPLLYQLALIGYAAFAKIRPWLPKRK
jgi:predicted DCC family thiol-disulfide oxidoreductase YuxK